MRHSPPQYTQGRVERPSYGQVTSGITGHTEALQLLYTWPASSFAAELGPAHSAAMRAVRAKHPDDADVQKWACNALKSLAVSNEGKAKILAAVPQLVMVEGVDSVKLATALDKAVGKQTTRTAAPVLSCQQTRLSRSVHFNSMYVCKAAGLRPSALLFSKKAALVLPEDRFDLRAQRVLLLHEQ